MKNELLELGTKAVNHAERIGATQVESYLESTRTMEVNIEKGLMKPSQYMSDFIRECMAEMDAE